MHNNKKKVIIYLILMLSLFNFNIYTINANSNINAFDKSLGGNAVSYPWSLSQTNIINPAYSSIQEDIYGDTNFFNFSYFLNPNNNTNSLSWSLNFGDSFSYSFVHNRNINKKDQIISIPLPKTSYFHAGINFRWTNQNNDIDEALDIGGLISPKNNITVGFLFQNFIAPEINNQHMPWIFSTGIGYKPFNWLGLTLNTKTSEVYDERYSGGIEINPVDEYSFRVGIDENNKYIFGSSFNILFSRINLSYKYDYQKPNNNSVYMTVTPSNEEKSIIEKKYFYKNKPYKDIFICKFSKHFNKNDDYKNIDFLKFAIKLEKISKNNSIDGVLLNYDSSIFNNSTYTISEIHEIGKQIVKIRQRNKKVIFYSKKPFNTKSYLLASYCNKIILNPNSSINLKNLSNKKQLQKRIKHNINYKKTLPSSFLITPKKAKKHELIHKIANLEKSKQYIKNLYTNKKYKIFFSTKYIESNPNETTNTIALISIRGKIHQGHSKLNKNGYYTSTGFKSLKKQLKNTKNDNNIKAIVIRLASNSNNKTIINKISSYINNIDKPIICSITNSNLNNTVSIVKLCDKIFIDKFSKTNLSNKTKIKMYSGNIIDAFNEAKKKANIKNDFKIRIYKKPSSKTITKLNKLYKLIKGQSIIKKNTATMGININW